jgi:plasmid stabilization system protein ParE
MGSRPTLAHPNPTGDLNSLSGHLVRQQSPAEAQPTIRGLEQAFDRLNPDYGVPADAHNPYGWQAMRDREVALSLGTRVAVATSRENDPNPVMWLAGQDYRVADATHRARVQAIRQRHGPQRPGPER